MVTRSYRKRGISSTSLRSSSEPDSESDSGQLLALPSDIKISPRTIYSHKPFTNLFTMAGVSSDSSGDSPSPKYGTEKHSATTEEEVEFGGLETLGSRTAAASDDIDPALDARITRKFDLHILPWLFGIWLCAFIDRSNIGNARIQGLSTQLGLDVNNRFNIALTVFYILYILVDVPSNWIMKRVGAGLYLPGLIILWGIVGTCIGLVKTFGGLVALRMLLGLFEGGLFGGMVLYASMFYRRHQLLLRLALWYCAAPLSGAIGGLLAAGLGQIRHGGYNSWPWIFIVEGAATVVFGVLTLFFLPHTPATSRFLTEEEREGAVRRMQIDSHGTNSSSSVDQEKFSWKWVGASSSLKFSCQAYLISGPHGSSQHQHDLMLSQLPFHSGPVSRASL